MQETRARNAVPCLLGYLGGLKTPLFLSLTADSGGAVQILVIQLKRFGMQQVVGASCGSLICFSDSK